MLNDTRIRNATTKPKPYKLTDANGLYIEVRPTGSKLWRYRYRIDGKENVFAMGEFHKEADTPGHMSLDRARQERSRARELVKQGKHPANERNAQKALQVVQGGNTFEVVTSDWLAAQTGWSPKHKQRISRALKAEVFPSIGALPINTEPKVFAAAILKIMQHVASTPQRGRKSTKGRAMKAISIRQWCGAVFCYGVQTLRADTDPTSVLRGLVKRPPIKNKTPLTKDQLPIMAKRIAASRMKPTTSTALRLLMLLFVRPVEIRKAEWTEFDLDGAEWRIPAERMKKRELQVIPLPPQAVAILRELHAKTGGRVHLFPNVRRPNDCMSESTLNGALRGIGYENKFSAHGFRATATTMLHEQGFSERLIDLCLAHKERDTTKAAYNQYQYFSERRDLMNAWAGMVDVWIAGGTVVPIRRTAAQI